MRRLTAALTVLVLSLLVVIPSASAGSKRGQQRGAATCAGKAATVRTPAGSGVTVIGTPGDDVIIGTPGDDVIDGLAGNDIICGLDGDDTLSGSTGRDRILGGAGSDTIAGGGQGDVLIGHAGDDFIEGGPGRDRVRGGAGNDTLEGNGGRDILNGNAGVDACEPTVGRSLRCESSTDTELSPIAAAPVSDDRSPARAPAPGVDDGAAPDGVAPAPRGVDVATVDGSCRRIDTPAYPGESPWYSGGTFCSLTLSSTQVAPRLAGADENVTVGFLCNAANGPVTDFKSPWACRMSDSSAIVGGIHDLAPRDTPGPVSGRYDFVRAGHTYCSYAGAATYFGSGGWLPNEDVAVGGCFTLTNAGRIVWQ